MTQTEVIRSGRRLIRLSTAAALLTAFALGGLGVHLVMATQHSRALIRQQVRLTELVGVIRQLDEVLTMSARLAALTGDASWERRYRQYEPQLDDAIKGTIRLGPPGSQQAASETDVANLILVEMEHYSFELDHAGYVKEAKTVLFGPSYTKQKYIYASGMDQFTTFLNTHVQENLAADYRKAVKSVSVIGLAILALLGAWLVVLRTMRRWQTVLLDTHQQLARQAEELRLLNTDLDQKVHERTAELTRTNSTLETEVRERAKAVAVARTSENRFRMLASHAPAGIFMTDPTGDCTFVNDTWCRLTGLTFKQAEGRGWIHAIHPEDADRIVQEWYRCAKAGEAFHAEYRYRTPQGQVVWIQGSAIAMRDDRGTLAGYLGTAVDITARRKAAEDLKKKADELQALNSMMMGREERILELKHEVNVLLGELNREHKYS